MTTASKGTASARNAKLYYHATEMVLATALATMVEVERVKGHKLPLGATDSQIKGRDLLSEISVPGWLQVGPLSFQYRHLKGATDDVFDDLWDSFINQTPYLWLEMDCDKALVGATGNAFPAYVRKMDKSAEDENAIVYDIEASYCEAYTSGGVLVELQTYTTPTP
jgi:hypothetical protein